MTESTEQTQVLQELSDQDLHYKLFLLSFTDCMVKPNCSNSRIITANLFLDFNQLISLHTKD